MGQKFPSSVFRGRYFHLIDEKGRLSIPVQFREVLKKVYKKEKLTLTGLDYSLVAYPLPEWLKIEEKLNNLSEIKPEVRDFRLLFISGAVECDFDRQGRILIPPALRKHADLKKEVVIAGNLKNFQIWDRNRWEEKVKRVIENFEKISEVVGDLGL